MGRAVVLVVLVVSRWRRAPAQGVGLLSVRALARRSSGNFEKWQFATQRLPFLGCGVMPDRSYATLDGRRWRLVRGSDLLANDDLSYLSVQASSAAG